MTQEDVTQIGLVLEEIVRDLEIISQEEAFLQASTHLPELTLDMNMSIHYCKETAWKYLKTLEKVKSNLEEALEEDKAKVVSKFIKYCEKTENLDDLLEDQLPANLT